MGKLLNRKKRLFSKAEAEDEDDDIDEIMDDCDEYDDDDADNSEEAEEGSYEAEEDTGDGEDEEDADRNSGNGIASYEGDAGKDNEDDDDDDEVDGEEDDEDEDDDEEDDEDEDDDDDEVDDEDDEDDDEEDDEDDEDDDDDIEEETEEDRRYYRRKRRIRNQIIAYGVVGILFAALIAGGVLAGQKVARVIKEKRQMEELEAAQLEQQQEQEVEDMVVEAPPQIELATAEEQLEELVNNCISAMPLEDKVAGLFIITPEALTGVKTVIQAGDSTQEALNKYAVGGLIYFDHNIENKEQLTAMLSAVAPMSKYPIFLAVDEEGGTVSRIANSDSDIEVAAVGDMATIGANGDTTAAREAGVTIGTYLKELGFNLNFAPVADVVTDPENSAIGSRSFGTDAGVCSEMVSNVVEGMQGTGVSACLKHFPGIGSAAGDTHDGKVEIDNTLGSMRNSDFLPFQAGIQAGVDFVMVGHVVATAIDTEMVPSSLSKVMVTEVLRQELGYNGIVITDALNMGAITENYSSEEAAIKAIEAGVDMLLMPEDFEAAYTGLLTAVQEGKISEERIDESLRRVYRIKYADKLA